MHRYRLIFPICICFVLCGCTASVWQRPSYNEQISEFYLSKADGKRLLVAQGQEFAYLFEKIDDEIWAALTNSLSISFRPWAQDWSLDEDSSVTGTLTLFTRGKEMTEEQRSFLTAHGFTKSFPDSWAATGLERNRVLAGSRIASTRKGESHVLPDPIYVRIERPRTSSDVASSAALTPAGLIYDATILPIVAIGFGVVAISDSRQ